MFKVDESLSCFSLYFDGSADLLLHKKGSIKSAQLCWVNVKTDKTWQKSQAATALWVVLNAVIVTLLSADDL